MDRLHGLMEISWIHTIHEGKLRNYFRWFCSASLTIAIFPPLFRRYWSYIYQFSYRPLVDGHDHMAPPWRYMGY